MRLSTVYFCAGVPAPTAQRLCPRMEQVCSLFKRSQWQRLSAFTPLDQHKRQTISPRLWWATAVPQLDSGGLNELVTDGHHLNAAAACHLPRSAVIDRRGALDALEPDRRKQAARFWWRNVTTTPHVRAEANHAFNRVLLQQLAAQQPVDGAAVLAHRVSFVHARESHQHTDKRGFEGADGAIPHHAACSNSTALLGSALADVSGANDTSTSSSTSSGAHAGLVRGRRTGSGSSRLRNMFRLRGGGLQQAPA